MNDQVMSIATRVAGQLPADTRKNLALGTIDAIAEVLVEVVKLCKQWHQQPTKALATIQNPNLIDRIRLRRAVYRRIKDPRERSEALDALLASRHGITQDDINTLLQAAGEQNGK